MPSTPVNFTTGPSLLPDVGQLSYNGCIFSPLFVTTVSGTPLKDEGERTVKYTKLVIEVDGYVTLLAGAASISPSIVAMHRLLTAQGGALIYNGRGFDININTGLASKQDLAWGPVPELMEFQPLGGGLSAKIKWRVTVHISGMAAGRGLTANWPKITSPSGEITEDIRTLNLLQFNFESSVEYGEDGFSTLTLRGTLEIPLARTPTQGTRTLAYTADDVRPIIQSMAMHGIDLSRFRIIRRDFSLSRDKRTITWNVTAEEKPYMDLPPNCTIARGTYVVKPSRTGPGLCLWMCSLSATYTVAADVGRRQAWLLFLALLRLRMAASDYRNLPTVRPVTQNPLEVARDFIIREGIWSVLTATTSGFAQIFRPAPGAPSPSPDLRAAILMDFSISEGLYLDSKTVTFSATWKLCTTFSHILVASGLWTKIREYNDLGRNLWATSVRNISGPTSWLHNRHDPAYDVIVDFGS